MKETMKIPFTQDYLKKDDPIGTLGFAKPVLTVVTNWRPFQDKSQCKVIGCSSM